MKTYIMSTSERKLRIRKKNVNLQLTAAFRKGDYTSVRKLQEQKQEIKRLKRANRGSYY